MAAMPWPLRSCYDIEYLRCRMRTYCFNMTFVGNSYYFLAYSIKSKTAMQSEPKSHPQNQSGFWFGLMLNVSVNNFSVMFGRSNSILGITNVFFFSFFFSFLWGGGG